ncbi:hypothetical protein ABEF95_005091 [Exophiala dermatitidis]
MSDCLETTDFEFISTPEVEDPKKTSCGYIIAVDQPTIPCLSSPPPKNELFTMAKPVWKGNHPVQQINQTRPLYRVAATGLGAAMWFFLMYRAKKDGPALIGLKHPWDH